MKIVKAGERSQLVDLTDVPETSVSSYGQPSADGVFIGTFHCSIRRLKGDEILNVRQMWPTAQYIVEMDWLGSAIPVTTWNPNSLVLPEMKLIHKKNGVQIKVLNILEADNVEELDKMWKLTCDEYAGATA